MNEEYIVPKPAFNERIIKRGYFIEVTKASDPLYRSNGVVTEITDDMLRYVDSSTCFITIKAKEVDEEDLRIKVAKQLGNYLYYIIRKVEINKTADGWKTLHLELTDPKHPRFDCVYINGEAFCSIAADKVSGQKLVNKIIDDVEIGYLDKSRTLVIKKSKEFEDYYFNRIEIDGEPYVIALESER